MTTIPYDTGNAGERPDVGQNDASGRIQATGQRAEDSTRRLAAAIAGALEGLSEALERYDVAEEGKEAIHQAGEVSRAAAVEGKELSQTPEMRQLGHQMQSAGHKTSETAHHAADNVRAKAQDVRAKAHDVRENARERIDHVRDSARHAKEEVKVRAEAVAESGRRAKVAPRRIGHELSEALSAWKTGLMTSLGMWAMLILFSAIALIVLTIALVVGLNALIGDPAGTFVVALLYLVIAGIAWGVAKGARSKAKNETKEHMHNAREEARNVGAPVRDAFSRGRGI